MFFSPKWSKAAASPRADDTASQVRTPGPCNLLQHLVESLKIVPLCCLLDASHLMLKYLSIYYLVVEHSFDARPECWTTGRMFSSRWRDIQPRVLRRDKRLASRKCWFSDLNWRTKSLTSTDTAVSLAGLGSKRGWNRGSAARLMLSGREQWMFLCLIIHRVVLSLWSFWLCFVFFFARWFSIDFRTRFTQVGGTPAPVCSTHTQGAPTLYSYLTGFLHYVCTNADKELLLIVGCQNPSRTCEFSLRSWATWPWSPERSAIGL